MKYVKQVIYAIFIISFTIMFFIILKDYSLEHKVVAEVGDSEIKEKDVDKVLEDLYRKTAVTRLVNDKLIQKEAQRLGYGHLNKEEREKAEKYYRLVYNLEGKDLRGLNDEIELFYKTLLLIKKYTVTEDELKKFWEREKNNVFPPTYHILVYKDNDHRKLQMIEDKLASGASLSEIKKEFGIDFKKVSVNKEHSLYASLEGLKPGEFIHSHNYSDDDNAQESSHAVIILESIERDKDKKLEDNKEEVLDFYAMKNIFKEKIELINYLKSKYKVRLEKY